jgi:maleate isomerase
MRVSSNPGAAYGWRARIGFIQPSMGNPNHPHEFYLMVPEGVTISIVSLRWYEDPETPFLSDESLSRVVRRIPLGVRELAAQGVNVVVQAGIPHLTAQPRGIEATLAARAAEITSAPFVMDVRASIQALQRLGLGRVLMVSPFTEAAGASVAEYVRPDGIEVVKAHRANLGSYGGLYGVPLGAVYQEVKEAFRGMGRVDGVWLPGAAMPTVAVIDALERDLGVPVVSSKQAMVWAALAAARVAEPVVGFGRLFQSAPG